MLLPPFKLERFFDRYEFRTRYLLSASDCEGLTQRELLSLASAENRRRWEELSLGYTEARGLPALRQAISGLYRHIAPAGVLVAAPSELIFLFFNAHVRPGDRVAAVFPAYQSLHDVARARGAQLELLPLQPTASGWTLDLDHVEAVLAAGVKLLVLNFPHNPTGYLPTPAEFAQLMAAADRHGVLVFADEMYRGLEYDPADRLPSAADLSANCVALSGMSKAYALAGLRIGWLTTQCPALLDPCVQLKDFTTICSSAPSEVLALIGLDAGEAILARNRAIVRGNLEGAAAFFERFRECLEWLPPRAGSVCFPRYRGPDGLTAFCQRALAEQEVLLVPGDLFDVPAAQGYFRLGLGRLNFCDGLTALAQVLLCDG
jgi:aspartate/methionine/tyrosine aminotransferase